MSDRDIDRDQQEQNGAGDVADQPHGGRDRHGEGKDAAADEGKPDKPALYKRPLFWVILVAVTALIVIGSLLYWLHARKYESTDDAFIDAHIVRISTTVAGTLTQVADVDNRHVDAGRLLAVVEPTGPQAQLAEANANVQAAVAQVRQAQAQVDAAIASRRQALSQSLVPLANAQKAAQDLARYEALARLDRAAVAGQQLDQARANARSTAADAAAARRQVDNADAQIAVARRQVAAVAAAVGARRAQVQQAQVTVGNAQLTAPVAGQVVNRQVSVGSYVGPGTQLMAIVPDRMWITANFKETQLQNMRIGQPVTIQVDAYPGVEFRGRVDSIQRGAGQAFQLLPAQNATGNYVKVVQRVPVRIEFDVHNGPDPRRYAIGPGMSVVPTVEVR